MEKFVEKISSFHLLTNLVPGTVFCLLINRFTGFFTADGETLADFIIFYFIGVIISRFGSIILEPVCKKLKIVKYASYSNFLDAEKKDGKIIALNEANDLYRSLLSCSVLFAAMCVYEFAGSKITFLLEIKVPVLCVCLIVLFTLAYRKQTSLIRQRIEHDCKTED